MANALTNNGRIRDDGVEVVQKLTLVADTVTATAVTATAEIDQAPDEIVVHCSAVSAAADDTLYPVVSYATPNIEVDVNGEVSGGATATYVILCKWYRPGAQTDSDFGVDPRP